jgi:hypothetical protein
MTQKTPMDTKALLERAKASEHKEAYQTLEKNQNYRIGAGVRLISPDTAHFFVEVLIYLCSSFSDADLEALKKSLRCLEKLKARNYALACQDGNCISCEASVTDQNLVEECNKAKELMKTHFANKGQDFQE